MAALSRRPALGESGSAAKRQRTEQMSEWGSGSNATAKIAGGSASIPPCAYGDSRSCGSQPHPRRTCTEKEVSRYQQRHGHWATCILSWSNDLLVGLPLRVQGFTISRCQRRELVLWMLETVDHLGFCAETLHLAVNYFDRFVSQALLPGGHRFTPLLGVTCLWTASKYEEVQSPTASESLQMHNSAACDVCGKSMHDVQAVQSRQYYPMLLMPAVSPDLHPTGSRIEEVTLSSTQPQPSCLSIQCLDLQLGSFYSKHFMLPLVTWETSPPVLPMLVCIPPTAAPACTGGAVQQGSAALQPSRIAALALSTALTRAGQPERVSSVMQLAAWDNQHCIAHLAQALLQEFDHRQACLAQNQYCPIMARYANAQSRLDLAASAFQPVARSTRSHAVSYPPSLGNIPPPQHHALLPEAAPQQQKHVVTSQQCVARGQE
ncbi:cyclin-AB-1, partial [Haematococcus lacustris]